MTRIAATISLLATLALFAACQQSPDIRGAPGAQTRGTANGSRIASDAHGQSHQLPDWAVGIDSYQ